MTTNPFFLPPSRLQGRGRGRVLPSVFLLAAATTTPAAAQQTEEIIVTATRSGEQSLQSVPVAVTAIDPANLNRAGALNLADLSRYAPALNITEAGPGINKIEIRGLTTGQLVPNSTSDVQDRSLVAVYLDDAAISLQGQNPDLKVIDLERVEVLRGPQGTLFGAGSMSGTIRYITAKPDTDRAFGTAEVQGSRSEEASEFIYNLRAMVNAPLIAGKLALRATAYYGRDAGFIDNLGAQNNKDANSVTHLQGRLAARWKATDALTADLSYTYLQLDADGLNRGFAGLPDYSFSSNGPEHNKDRMHLVNLTLNHDADWGSITSSTTYTNRKLDFLESLEPTVAYFFQFAPPGPDNPFNDGSFAPPRTYNQALTNLLPVESYSIKNDIEDFQQELRFSSPSQAPFRVTAGAFYQRQKRYYLQDIPFPLFDTLSYEAINYNQRNPGKTYDSRLTDGAFSSNNVFSGIQDIDEYQVAAFGEASYDLTDKLTILAGARVFYWEQTFDLYFGGVFGVNTLSGDANRNPLTVDDTRNASGINPRFVASYQATPDILVFAEAAKGFRYGGVNQPLPDTCNAELAAVGGTAPQTFGPDSLWTYSIGEKARLFDKRLTINGTAFLIDWSNVQNRVVLPQCSYYYIQNNGKVRSLGAELEIAARVTEALTLTFAGSYTDATSRIDVPGAQARAGDKVPNFPGTIIGVGALYDQPLAGGTLHAALNWQYRQSYGNLYNRNGNPAQSTSNAFNYRTIPAQDTLNASIAYQVGAVEIGVFGTNLTNGTRITNIVPRAQYIGNWQAGDYLSYARPRTIGLRLRGGF